MYQVEINPSVQTMETSIWATRCYPKEGTWEVGGVICKSVFVNHLSNLSWVLHITPPYSHEPSFGSTSCGLDWSFHRLHRGIGFHLICSLLIMCVNLLNSFLVTRRRKENTCKYHMYLLVHYKHCTRLKAHCVKGLIELNFIVYRVNGT
jgi:hypothetical protein